MIEIGSILASLLILNNYNNSTEILNEKFEKSIIVSNLNEKFKNRYDHCQSY